MENKQTGNYISEFYDQFSKKLNKVGTNVRHRTILHNLKKAGLKKNSTVLEIGCGIGTVTRLIATYCSSGKIVGVDISPKSIELAVSRNKKLTNIEFLVSDMKGFSYPLKFDFIVLPDVLEHIPLEEHKGLFKTISEHIHADSTVAINIPDPYTLEYLRKTEPGSLQVIDQSLFTNLLTDNIYSNGFFILELRSYALAYKQNDYQWLLLKVRKHYNKLEKKPSLDLKLQELKSRLFY